MILLGAVLSIQATTETVGAEKSGNTHAHGVYFLAYARRRALLLSDASLTLAPKSARQSPEGNFFRRKVRAPQGAVPGNAWEA